MRVAGLFGLLVAASLAAAPPPPPPDYVSDAGKLLIAKADHDAAKLAPLFADDVAVFENGKQIAAAKPGWMALVAADLLHYNGRVLAFSEGFGSARLGEGSGMLLVIDTFDTVDRTNLLPTFLADPRMATRTTLYQFGADHLIHIVRIVKVDGFPRTPQP